MAGRSWLPDTLQKFHTGPHRVLNVALSTIFRAIKDINRLDPERSVFCYIGINNWDSTNT